MGRDLRLVRRGGGARARREHSVADCLGAARVDRGGAGGLPGRPPRRPLPARAPGRRRRLGRGVVHGRRVPRLGHRRGARRPHPRGQRALRRFHDPLPPLPQLLPAARAGPIPGRPAPAAEDRPVPKGCCMRSRDFYQRHLDAVSRSFALCIPQLDSPFRERVALSYLLLRVLDTVEDAPFQDRQLQQRQFETFRRFLRMPPARAQVDVFRASFLGQITEGERNLLADTQAFLEDAHQLPAGARDVIFGAVDRMAQGMAAYQLRPAPLRLLDLEDVTRYCCIVAGLVGELLTRLWALGGEAPPRMIFAYRFGLFLQKVNILKDQAEDEMAGRFLVPDRREILASLRADGEGAIAYLTSLPRAERGYRTVSALYPLLTATSLQS